MTRLSLEQINVIDQGAERAEIHDLCAMARDAVWADAYRTVVPAGQGLSVQQIWATALPLQQQSVLLLALRGADGTPKHHPHKAVQRAYRASVLVAAKYGRPLRWGEKADSFMGLDHFADRGLWECDRTDFFGACDELPSHFVSHLMHGAEILGYKHPDERFRDRWREFYLSLVSSLHLQPETEAQMDARLGDWGRESWDCEVASQPASAGMISEGDLDRLDEECRRREREIDSAYGGECQSTTPPDERMPILVHETRALIDSLRALRAARGVRRG